MVMNILIAMKIERPWRNELSAWLPSNPADPMWDF